MRSSIVLFLVSLSMALGVNPLVPGARGYSIPELESDAFRVSFWGQPSFDPLVSGPAAPEAAGIDSYPGDGTGYYLVQFAGPVNQFQLDELRRSDCRFVGFHSRYLAFVKMDRTVAGELRGLPFVRWIGVYQPGYKYWPGTLSEHGFGRVSVIIFQPEDLGNAVADIAALGGAIVRTGVSEFTKVVEVDCSQELLTDIARLPYVFTIEEWHPPQPENNQCQWVAQTWEQNNRRVWNQGIFGTDEILGYTDTGLDVNHYAFRDPVLPLSDTGEFPNHRKVVVFKHYPAASGVGDPDGHGTHVGGTIAGSDSANGGTNTNDGHSRNARIVHLSPIPSPPGNDFTIPFNMITNQLRYPSLRPRTISNSWYTGTMGQYTNASASVDRFCWQNKDIVLIKSCGNQGQSGQRRITEPGNSKSIIAAGSVLNGTSATQLSTFSSRGPAPDGRIKPDIVIPGENIYSAQVNTTNSYASASGTSMAAPATNGSVGLLRSYLRKGYYPSGAPNAPDSFGYVSAALLKAMVLVSADPNIGSYTIPSEYVGWGRVDLDSVLYFSNPSPDVRKLLVYDDTLGLATSQYQEYQFQVSSAIPLRISVVWTDTAAAPGANPCLINNLNCLLTAPGGTYYRGNIYSSGQSAANPAQPFDALNPLEMFRVNNPGNGTWTLRVTAQNVVTARQPYAVVITGGIAFSLTDVGVTQLIAPTGTIDSGTVVTPQARVKNFGSAVASFPVTFRIGAFYSNVQNVSNLAPGDSTVVNFLNWTATQRGTHATKCTTALAGDQNPSNNFLTGSVTVRVQDVASAQLIAPSGTVDSGTVVTPQAKVKNLGTVSASFPVTFRIGGFYTNVQNVSNLAPGDSQVVNFLNWTAAPVGTHATRCTTALAGDQNPSNNALSGSVTVVVRDVGVAQILAPSGTLDSGAVIAPQAKVKNYGSLTASFSVSFRIGAFYTNSQNVTNLAPGDSQIVNFTNWTAVQRGTHVTRCSTALSGDQRPANNLLTGQVIVRVRDVGPVQILAPVGTVDSGSTVTPQVKVKNLGTELASFPVTFRIGAFYTNTQSVTNLAGGDSLVVWFSNWVATQIGSHVTRCSTGLVGDQRPSNDTIRGSVLVRVGNDVGVTQLLSPPSVVDSGTVVVPQARVRNFGANPATFQATFRIGGFYSNTQSVSNLAPGDSQVVNFANWTATQRGSHATKCTTDFPGDQNPSNNALSGNVVVRVLDAGVLTVLAPSGTVDSGAVVAPQAWVRNFGSAVATFPVTFRIGSYSSIRNATNLAPGDSVLLTFANWTAFQRGVNATRCTTALAGDLNPANDQLTGSVLVRVTDAGLVRIPVPPDTVDSGATVVPEAWAKNCGTDSAFFPVWFRIDDGVDLYGAQRSVISVQHSALSAQRSALIVPLSALVYEDSVWVLLAAGESVLVQFDPWSATPPGSYTAEASSELAGDQNSANDLVTKPFTVRPPQRDVGVSAIQVPAGTYDLGAVIMPAATWRNYGTLTADFEAWLALWSPTQGLVYTEKLDVTGLLPGEEIRADFPACTLGVAGVWLVRCSTYFAGDGNPANDVRPGQFQVTTAWREQASMPVLPSGSAVKQGGWLAYNEGDGLVYAAKGNKVGDFYAYNPTGNYWLTLSLIPAGTEGKLPKRGCRGIADGGRYVYMTKGNNTLGFWRYDVVLDSWDQMPDVPEGPSGKRVKGGTDLAYLTGLDGDYVYLLKGYGQEFWRYDVAGADWEQLENAPAGQAPKWNEGSWLEYDRVTKLYAHKARYHELWVYDVASNTWSSEVLAGMPFVGSSGRSKKSKDGGSAAWVDAIYALKGGNTCEFWSYEPASMVWAEFDTMPSYGSTGKKKRVKAGGDITAAGTVLYALKGNTTLELWSYRPSPALLPTTAHGSQPTANRPGIMSGVERNASGVVQISPNPLASGFATLFWTPGVERKAYGVVRIYDATGRCVLRQAYCVGRSASSILLDLRGLNAGVYLVKLESNSYAATRKLVIER